LQLQGEITISVTRLLTFKRDSNALNYVAIETANMLFSKLMLF